MKILTSSVALLVLALPACAQRVGFGGGGGGPRGGGGAPHVGFGGPARGSVVTSVAHRGYGYSGYAPTHYPTSAPYYGGGVSSYGFGWYPTAYTSNPYPESSNGGPTIIILMGERTEQKVIYIPSYQRPSNGPSLAELAAQLKAERKPSTVNWTNVEKILPPKKDE